MVGSVTNVNTSLAITNFVVLACESETSETVQGQC